MEEEAVATAETVVEVECLLGKLLYELHNPDSSLDPEIMAAGLEAILQNRSVPVGLSEVNFGTYRTAPMPDELWLRSAFVTTAQLGFSYATRRRLEARHIHNLGTILLYAEKDLRFLGGEMLKDVRECLDAVGLRLPLPRNLDHAKAEGFWVLLADHRERPVSPVRAARCQLPLMTMSEVSVLSGVNSAVFTGAGLLYFGEVLEGSVDDLMSRITRAQKGGNPYASTSATEWSELRARAKPHVDKFVAWMEASGIHLR